MKYLLGVDIGTTNVKAALFDRNGKSLGKVSEPYPTVYPRPGWAIQEPEDWYRGATRAILSLMNRTRAAPEDVLCVGFSGHIRTVAFLDAEFKTVYPGIVWSDVRSDRIARELNGEMEELLTEITGNRADTNYALPQILWMKKNRPDLFQRTRFFAAPKDYVVRRLTGNFVSDPSTQAGSLALDIRQKQWSEPLLRRFDIPPESLPELKQSIDIAGFIGGGAAVDAGLRPGTPVVLGGGDNDCAAIGAGAFEPGVVSVSLGTAGIVLTALRSPDIKAPGELDIFPHVIPGYWYAMGMVKAAGYAMDWLKARLADETAGASAPSMKRWSGKLREEIGEYMPGGGGLFCFPYYQGKGNPRKEPRARGVLWGLSSSHTNRHLMQASMEGVGYCIKECVQAIEKYVPITEIVCCGGGSGDALWTQIIADILGKPIWTGGRSEEGALGAAILASVGIRLYKDAPEACGNMTRYDRQYTPIRKNAERYRDLFEKFRALSNLFRETESSVLIE